VDATFEPHSLRTDKDGAFALNAATGDVMGIRSITKFGYEPGQFKAAYNYTGPSSHQPDPKNPVIFKMLDMQLATSEPLMIIHVAGMVRCDGTPHVINLLTSGHGDEPNTSGHVRVSFKRVPITINAGATDYDWELRIEMLNGGMKVCEEDERLMWAAPSDGYESTYITEMKRGDPDWKRELKIPFYFVTEDGKYFGRATLMINSGYRQERTALRIDGALNPAGSRLLKQKY
jgi:hypothetical protein